MLVSILIRILSTSDPVRERATKQKSIPTTAHCDSPKIQTFFVEDVEEADSRNRARLPDCTRRSGNSGRSTECQCPSGLISHSVTSRRFSSPKNSCLFFFAKSQG